MKEKKLSARRCGRLLTILYFKDYLLSESFEHIPPHYISQLEDFIPEFSLLPDKIQQQALKFAHDLAQNIFNDKKNLIQTITEYSKNRSWDRFYPLDKALLLVGTHSLQQDISALIVKEILISSDILENHHAAPYLSGILKSIAEKQDGTSPIIKKHTKIRLKTSL
ncbi:MAG: transcription antitermination factor NusB [Brevinema sp.]